MSPRRRSVFVTWARGKRHLNVAPRSKRHFQANGRVSSLLQRRRSEAGEAASRLMSCAGGSTHSTIARPLGVLSEWQRMPWRVVWATTMSTGSSRTTSDFRRRSSDTTASPSSWRCHVRRRLLDSGQSFDRLTLGVAMQRRERCDGSPSSRRNQTAVDSDGRPAPRRLS
jgi:hypothetical protein